MKSIKQKLMVSISALVTVVALICGGIGIFGNYTSAMSMLEQNLTSTAEVTAQRISYELASYRNAISALGMVPELSSAEVSVEQKEQIVQRWADYYGMERGNLLDRAGHSLFDGNNYSDRTYFQTAIQGTTSISTPIISKITGELSIMVAAPLWQNGVEGGTVAGVVYFVPRETFLNDIMTSIQVSENSGAYMIDATGVTIADTTLETVAVQNIEEEAANDPSLERLAAIHADMRQGNNGYDAYEMDGVEKSIAYAPVPGTDGWSVGITAPTSDFLGATYQSLLVIAIFVVAMLVVSVLISLKLAYGIGQPIKVCAERLDKLAHGDLTSEIPEYKHRDEIGMLARDTRSIVETLGELIGDEEYLLGEMANGNFNVRSRNYEIYRGDYSGLLTSLRNINCSLSETLQQIDQAADQVSAGAGQVSSGAQALAQGATEQASAVEELSATISEIDHGAQKNAKAAQQVKEKTDQTGEQVLLSHKKMKELAAAMDEILESHQEIAQIIGTIENIAFQTNILALNAAVEAARAGASGKGFAVVADEVRNLASKSDHAAKQTKEIIERSTQSIERGSQLSQEVGKALNKTAEYTGETVKFINEMANNIIAEANSVDQVSEGIDQISSVVQTNSATAEESAAASEELSSQAQLLKSLTGRFQFGTQTEDMTEA